MSLGRHFAAEAAYRSPSRLLHISRQVSQEALIAFSAIIKRPWRIIVIANPQREAVFIGYPTGWLGAISPHSIQLRLSPRTRQFVASAQIPISMSSLIQNLQRLESLFHAVHQVWCGVDEICRKLADSPVERDIEIC